MVAALVAVSLGHGVAAAQTSSTATLRGRVLDPQSQPVPGAKVAATASATGWSREATTDTNGQILLPDLPPTGFVVAITATGFAPHRFEAVTLRVGQVLDLHATLTVAGVREDVVVDAASAGLVDTARSVVDAVITGPSIDRLPLNGRNFMELALLVPGNAPAPNFDPTKTNSVVISSAGQLGRGGNITIDGMDNNDDMVGGPLLNIVQEGVQEFQIATSRFAADLGRSAGSAINVVTRSGSDALHGSASMFFRDDAMQAAPVTADRSLDPPPFDRQQVAGSVGGPLRKGNLFGFGAVEYRNQDGAVQVGTRDTTARVIRRSFATAPLDDVMGLARIDWQASANDHVLFRYSGQNAKDVASSGGDRPIASATQRQEGTNKYYALLGTWTRVLSSQSVNSFSVSLSDFDNSTVSLSTGPQYTFPSLEDGSSFRVPQNTVQRRWQFADTFSYSLGSHALRAGGEVQRVDAGLGLGVFRAGRVELVQDFPQFDANGDGQVNDNDLLFAVTLRSGKPDQDLLLSDVDNTHAAFFIQDDWRVRSNLTINLGLRYELDTDVKNIARYDEINPIVQPFLKGERGRDLNNFGPRIGFNWSTANGKSSVHGGYGIYFDRITLEIQTLERGLDGRALPIEVRAGSAIFLDIFGPPLPPFAPSISNPFTGFILPGAGASGINIIDNTMQNPQTQQFNLGIEHQVGDKWRVRLDGIHALGTHFIIGRDVGVVFNPVVGGPDRVVNLESSVRTHYDALLASVERRLSQGLGVRASYAFSKALNYANDDQIPFSNGPIDSNNLYREYGPTPNDQRHRFTLAASWDGPAGFNLSTIWTLASGVPMDILLPSAASRIPELQRNAGGRLFKNAGELNAYLRDLNSRGGVGGEPLPLVSQDARFNDRFDSVDLRIARPFALRGSVKLEPIVEIFNVFNVTNFLGYNKKNYSGFANALVRDSGDPSTPGYLTSSSFGRPVSTAGGVFGSGGPRAAQLAVRVLF
jgi:hypothetical protein